MFMSWIDRELKKRVHAASHSKLPQAPAVNSETENMTALWRKLEAVNDALPPELKLAADLDLPANPAFGVPKFLVWFRASNGAGLGFTGDAIRYVWPERNERASYNFWIRWTPDDGFRLIRRVVSAVSGPKIVDRSFSQRRAEYMIKCLVVGRRISPRAVRKKRLWLF
jgi:hypothetical protein